MPLKIASWNVNSLRVRLPHLQTWIAHEQPDVIALQEIKVEDKDFPMAEITALGYHAVFNGQKTYNGVALLSKRPLEKIEKIFSGFSDEQRRMIAGSVGDVRIVNVYVPNGSSVGSDKYEYKLNWLKELRLYLRAQLSCFPKLMVLGDFNIAPDDRDVHDPKAWEGNVLVSPLERASFQELIAEGLVDAFRLFEQEKGHYTWWDYRLNAFKRNLGLRIDHILMSHALETQCSECRIDKTPRSWERPSDHTPIIAHFDVL